MPIDICSVWVHGGCMTYDHTELCTLCGQEKELGEPCACEYHAPTFCSPKCEQDFRAIAGDGATIPGSGFCGYCGANE